METRKEAKYQGVILDRKLSFSLQTTHGKTLLDQDRVNVDFCQKTFSILQYGFEIWAEARKIKKYRKPMVRYPNCIEDYLHLSEGAVLAIAGVIQIDLLVL